MTRRDEARKHLDAIESQNWVLGKHGLRILDTNVPQSTNLEPEDLHSAQYWKPNLVRNL